MRYFNLRRSRIILGAFLLFAIVMVAFPHIDLWISGHFFDGRSFPRGRWWQDYQRSGLKYFLLLSVIAVFTLYALNRAIGRTNRGVDGRQLLYVLLVLGLGAGLIVNTTLKDNFGRARPRDIAEFGGTKIFTPAFVVSGECNTNCSFSSGDAAGGFFAIALAFAFSRRRAIFAAAVAFGALISLSRIVSGAHFFSDTVVSFFVMFITADLLRFYVLASQDARDAAAAPVVAARAQI